MFINLPLVETYDEIINNTKTLDQYLDDDNLRDFAIGLIKRGICFIAVEKDQQIRFYPSRYVGYKQNTQHLHIHNTKKDGRDTNPAISKILDIKLEPSQKLDELYRLFCESLGFRANEKGAYGVERKYWQI